MLNVGVIGCGGMGKDHIKRLTNKIQGANVVAVSDVFEEGAKEAAALAGGAKVYTDGKDLINDPDVDAVLSYPQDLHIPTLFFRRLNQEKGSSVKNRWQQQRRTVRRL